MIPRHHSADDRPTRAACQQQTDRDPEFERLIADELVDKLNA
jgi:hypothetical protein